MTKKYLTKNFNFKQFSIIGGSAGMPVSTDGVLLGAWADANERGELLDIGTGTGLLTLMMAQRFPKLKITAVDINEDAIEAAKINVEHSTWSERITVYHADIKDFSEAKCFSSIICNPPYFMTGERTENLSRATARHTDTLSYADLLKSAWMLSTDDAIASFILPVAECEQFIQQALAQGWFLQKVCHVSPTDKKQPTRRMLKLIKSSCQTTEEFLTIRVDGDYSSDFIALTREFYLKM
ncbi:methyltransferase [Vibrio sp.]|nr:methyltransferase [Vibrio sp.]